MKWVDAFVDMIAPWRKREVEDLKMKLENAQTQVHMIKGFNRVMVKQRDDAWDIERRLRQKTRNQRNQLRSYHRLWVTYVKGVADGLAHADAEAAATVAIPEFSVE